MPIFRSRFANPVYNRLASNQTINSTATLQDIISIDLPIGTWEVDLWWGLNGTANTGTRHGFRTTLTTNVIRGNRMRSSSFGLVPINAGFNLGLAETSTDAWFTGVFEVTAAGSIFIQAAQNTSHVDSVTVNTYTRAIARALS
jgi:hypothetical protein